ncbi:hypothetical protein ACH5RR_026392 [Cinchona calisaya]|uniref:Uncharacterized protein n=1 Tax=Cinchona calisaya TaxID=153742 RepID=A0ABD2Z5V2_9GENT
MCGRVGSDADKTLVIDAFMSGVKARSFNAKLASKVPKTFKELLQCAKSHICAKESNRTKREQYDPKSKRKRPVEHEPDKRHFNKKYKVTECLTYP